MLPLIGLAIVFASAIFGFTSARNFVRTRLRYVDAARSMRAPVIAGVIAGGVALLPFGLFLNVPVLSAAFFGFSVAAGVRAGARDIQRNAGYIEGP